MDGKDLLVIGGIGLLAYFFITNQTQSTGVDSTGTSQLEQPFINTNPFYTPNYPPSLQPQSPPVIVMPSLPSDNEPLSQTLATSTTQPKKIQSTPQYDIFTNFDISKPENYKLASDYVNQNKTLIYTDKPSLQAGDKVIIHDVNLRVSTTGYVSSSGQIISTMDSKKQSTASTNQYSTPANQYYTPASTSTQYYTPASQSQPKKTTQPSNNINNIVNTVSKVISTITSPTEIFKKIGIIK